MRSQDNKVATFVLPTYFSPEHVFGILVGPTIGRLRTKRLLSLFHGTIKGLVREATESSPLLVGYPDLWKKGKRATLDFLERQSLLSIMSLCIISADPSMWVLHASRGRGFGET